MKSGLPPLVRFMAVHATIGFIVAGVFTAGLIVANPGDIGTLLRRADDYPLPTLLLWFMLGLTSSSCQMGAAIMLLGSSSGGDQSGKRLAIVPGALRLPLPARAPRGSR